MTMAPLPTPRAATMVMAIDEFAVALQISETICISAVHASPARQCIYNIYRTVYLMHVSSSSKPINLE